MLKKTLLGVALLGFLPFLSFSQSQIPNPATPQPGEFQPVVIHSISPSTPNPIPGNMPPANNGTAVYDADVRKQAQMRQDYQDAMVDVKEAFGKPTISYTLPSHRSDAGASYYMQAYGALKAMLEGETQASLKRAVFLVEGAYFEGKLSYEAYNSHIQTLAAFCRSKMREEHIDATDNAAMNDLLFHFISDTMAITDPTTKKKITHQPFRYDFEDFYGKDDWTKMFVTKLMATSYGQCHSMPLLYNILAEELGIKAYLSASPSHLFIKYRKGNGFQNVELTNGHLTTDAYVIGSGYIKSEAIRNKLYLDTLSPVQAIALMMQDLGKGYYVKYGFDDFVEQCANTGLQYYPNDAYGMAIKSDYNTVLFQYVVSQLKGMTPQQVLAMPEPHKLYDNMHAIYRKMDDAGYTQMPEDAYEDWLKSIDKEKRKQEYDLFLQYRKTHKMTLQDGRN